MMKSGSYSTFTASNVKNNYLEQEDIFSPLPNNVEILSPTSSGQANQGMLFNYKDKYLVYINAWNGVRFAPNSGTRTTEKQGWIEVVRYNNLNDLSDFTVSPKITPFVQATQDVVAGGIGWTLSPGPWVGATPPNLPNNLVTSGYTYDGLGVNDLTTDYIPTVGEFYTVYVTTIQTVTTAGTLGIVMGGQTQNLSLPGSTGPTSFLIYFDNITNTSPLTVTPYNGFVGTVKIALALNNYSTSLFKFPDDDNLYLAFRSWDVQSKVPLQVLENYGNSTSIKLLRFNIETMTSSFIDYEVVLERYDSNYPQPFPTDLNSKQVNWTVSVAYDDNYIYFSDCSPYPVVNKFLRGTSLGTWTHQGKYTSNILSGSSIIGYHEGFLYLVQGASQFGTESYKDGIYNNGSNIYYSDKIAITKIDSSTLTVSQQSSFPESTLGIPNATYGGPFKFTGSTYNSLAYSNSGLFGTFVSSVGLSLFTHQSSSFDTSTKGMVFLNGKLYLSKAYFNQTSAVFHSVDVDDITIHKSYCIPGFINRCTAWLFPVEDQLFAITGGFISNENANYYESSSNSGLTFYPLVRICQFNTQTQKFVFLKDLPMSLRANVENLSAFSNAYFNSAVLSKDGSVAYTIATGNDTGTIIQKQRY